VADMMIVSILFALVIILLSLVLALKFIVFKKASASQKSEKKVVSILTLRVLFSIILLALCYLHLSSL
jgi:hypothetical protein